MKKFFALLIAAMLLMTGTALAAKLDLSFVEENDDVYTLDVNTEANVAFVESRVSVKESSFTHKYESEHRYNYTMLANCKCKLDTRMNKNYSAKAELGFPYSKHGWRCQGCRRHGEATCP